MIFLVLNHVARFADDIVARNKFDAPSVLDIENTNSLDISSFNLNNKAILYVHSKQELQHQ